MRNVLAFRDPSPSSRLRMTRLRASLPPRNEQIRVPSLRVRAVRGPHEEFAVGAEHGEAVEGGRGGDALGVAGTVFVEDEDVELAAARVEDVRGVDDAFAVGGEVGAEVGGAVFRELARVGAVG